MLSGSGGVGKFCGRSPTQLPHTTTATSISPPHLEWVLRTLIQRSDPTGQRHYILVDARAANTVVDKHNFIPSKP
eukprot:gene27259-biopygen7831